MDRNLPRPRAAELANDQRAGLHDPVDQRATYRRTPRITKITQSSSPNRHLGPRKSQNQRESEHDTYGKQNV